MVFLETKEIYLFITTVVLYPERVWGLQICSQGSVLRISFCCYHFPFRNWHSRYSNSGDSDIGLWYDITCSYETCLAVGTLLSELTGHAKTPDDDKEKRSSSQKIPLVQNDLLNSPQSFDKHSENLCMTVL